MEALIVWLQREFRTSSNGLKTVGRLYKERLSSEYPLYREIMCMGHYVFLQFA
jgi:hypothetical protein